MYQSSYSDVIADSPALARSQERAAFDRAIKLLAMAETAPPGAAAEQQALGFITQLWTVLIKDLAHPENELSDGLRAQLISIGLWTLRHVNAIELGRSRDLKSIADICGIIRDGLV